MKVLVIEDEKALSESILAYLHSELYTCETAADFATAMEKISCYDYACIILDITLPGGSGLDILKELKAAHKTEGVLIISARNSLEEKILGLQVRCRRLPDQTLSPLRTGGPGFGHHSS